jgi:phosphate acetyltransferase
MSEPAMNFLLEMSRRIKNASTRVVFPEANEKRIINAAALAARQGIAAPILIGKEAEIRIISTREGLDLTGIDIVDPASSPKMGFYVDAYCKENNFPSVAARLILSKPLYFGAMMVKMGDADSMVAGVATETEEVVVASKLIIGMEEGISTPSSFLLMDVPGYTGEEDGRLIFADPAINPDPTPEELADIAIASARSARALFGWQPRVALLSFSTHRSASHPHITKVTDALEIVRRREPSLMIDGELQADAAIVPEVARMKVKRPSSVAGRANILIFPDLDAANIGYKLVQRLANAAAYGVFMQGFARPVSDLSRGATVDDIVGAITMVVIAAQTRAIVT